MHVCGRGGEATEQRVDVIVAQASQRAFSGAGVLCRIHDRCGELALLALERGDLLLDGSARDEPHHGHGLRLTHAMRAIGRLILDRRVPPRIAVNDGIGGGEGEAGAARLPRDQKERSVAVLEPFDDGGASQAVTVQVLVGDFLVIEVRAPQREEPDELREDQRAAPLRDELAHQLEEHRALRALRRRDRGVDQARVARHLAEPQDGGEHRDAAAREAALLDVLAHRLSQRERQRVVEALLPEAEHACALDLRLRRKIEEHLGLGPPEHEGPHERAQPLGDDATRFVVDGPLEALVELGARPEHAGIDEAHDRTELAEPVLDRGARERESHVRHQPLRGSRGRGGRALHVLRLVEDDAPKAQRSETTDVTTKHRVRRDHQIVIADLPYFLGARATRITIED